MQTFLPYPDFARTACVLDSRRLGKQRVEALQIMRALRLPTHGWRNHPAVRMWRGYEEALAAYGLAICAEWRARGHADTCADKIAAELTAMTRRRRVRSQTELRARGRLPPWLGRRAFHRSHRSALVRKDATWYGERLGDVPADLPYVWPVAARAGVRDRSPAPQRMRGPTGLDLRERRPPDRPSGMRRSAVVSVAAVALLLSPFAAFDASAVGNEPSTSTIRIRLKGPTLRVRCRGGDCDVSVVRAGTSYTVSITRTRNGVPFTFTRTVENPTNLAIETGLGNDVVSVVGADLPGFFRVYMADGADALTIVDTSARGKVAIDGGKGNDTLELSPGVFTGKFRLHGRAGDDTVTVNGGRFESKAGFAGGAGTDAFAAPTAYFASPPVVDGFEP